jgi:RimJ/RimL family protein N-acetyltransferase
MKIRRCTTEDIDLLAVMNQQLVEDEQCDKVRLTLQELKDRMSDFITGDYDAYFFVVGDDVVGYALVDRMKEPYYLKHFMIERSFRRMHYGQEAIKILIESLGTAQLEIEVYSWNERGIAFWESCGFVERCKYMRYSG